MINPTAAIALVTLALVGGARADDLFANSANTVYGADLPPDSINTVSGFHSIIIGRGQTVTQTYHLRIGSDKDHWIDFDLKTGKAIMTPGLSPDDAAAVCGRGLREAGVFDRP